MKMMMNDEMRILCDAEIALMDEWRCRYSVEPEEEPEDFNADGIVDPERWINLPDKKHIVVLLKDTNSLCGSLVDFLRYGGSETYYRTWNNVVRWVNMILNGTYWEFIPKTALDDMIRNIAAVNLKKLSGGSRANKTAVQQAARKDADLLKRQLKLYAPDIILTGGWGLVSNILHDEILHDDTKWTEPNDYTALWYYESDSICANKKTLIVSMPHPNRAAKRWTVELKKVLFATGRL